MKKSAVAAKTSPQNPQKNAIHKTPFQKIEPYLYITPALILFCCFVFFPFAKTLFLSLHSTTPKGEISKFVGFSNFTSLLTSEAFRNSLFVTVKYSLMVVFFSIAAGFITGVLANEKIPGTGLFRTIYSLPMAISSAAASIIFIFVFPPSIGILNYLLGTAIGWLISDKWALFSVVMVTVWMNIGLNFIFILAALQSVPPELYESASLEGAGFFRKHLSITLPCISPTLFFLLIINVINSFQSFAQINLMTKGGPGQSTYVIVYSIYQEAFFNNRFGLACAESVILFFIILALTLVQFRLEKKVTY